MVHDDSEGEGCDKKSVEPTSNDQQWLMEHLDKYVIQSKVNDEAALFEKENVKYSCELEVSVNCLELILQGLIVDDVSEDMQEDVPARYSKYLKKLIASLVEDVARHAIVIEHSPSGPRPQAVGDASPLPNTNAFDVIEEGQFKTITEGLELHFIPSLKAAEGTMDRLTIRLVQSSLKRNIKRKKAKPKYPAYMWVLAGSNDKRIIPPRQATDFYYRLLEGKVGYPLNYLGACINDLAAQGIIEVAGKKLSLTQEGAALAERLYHDGTGKGAISWKVRVSRKKK